MGKQRTTKEDQGLETVSNLDLQTETEKKNIREIASDRKPELLENEPEFISNLLPKMDEIKLNLFQAHGDSLVNDYPARCICLLVIIGADNRTYYATGFMISPRCVITAGHCLHFGLGWAKEIKVFPGADGPATPYGGEVATEYVSTNNWTKLRKPEHDYGAIILPSDDLFNRVKGYLGFRIIDQTGPIHLGGYPVSEDFRQITLHGVAKQILPYVITYDLPTVRGHSGSPVFIVSGNQVQVVAVHTYGGDPTYGIRVTDQVLSHWQNWMNRQQALV